MAGTLMRMLSIKECRQRLSRDVNQSLSDREIARIRDDMYTFARLALEILTHEQSSKQELSTPDPRHIEDTRLS